MTLLRFDAFELDPRTSELRRDGEPVPLQLQPAQVLAALAERPGELVPRQKLEDLLWPQGTHVDRAQGLNYCIRQIRLALDDDSRKPRYIETLPRRGYRFVAAVEPSPDEAPGTPGTDAGRHSPWLWWSAAGAVLALCLVLLVLAGFLAGKPPAKAPEGGSPAAGAAAEREILAVLPLENLGGDDVLAAGLTQELSSTLGQLDPRRLAVIAQTAVERHRDLGVEEMGEALGADYLLEGSVQQAGDRLRVSVRLVQVADQTQRWAQTYDFEASDAFRVQRAVARDISRALSLQLSALGPQELGGTTSPQAFEAFLQGMSLLRRSPPRPSPVPYFARAVDLDPNFARAWSFLADAYRQQRPYDPADLSLAHQAARRALELHPTSADAHLELGLLALYGDFDVATAELHIEQAVQLQPSLAMAHNHLGAVRAIRGRYRDAIAEIHEALVLDPGSLANRADLGWFAMYVGDYSTAIQDLTSTLEVSTPATSYWTQRALLGTYLCSGAWEDAAGLVTTWPEDSVAGRAVEAVPDDPRATVAAFLRGEIVDLRKRYEAGVTAPSTMAIDYALLDEPQEAVHWLRVSARRHWGWQIPFLRIDPRVGSLRGEPAFEALVAELGLPEPAATASGLR